MTYDDYNKIIEEIIASPSDDKIMLEGFDEELRQTKVNEFFNREDKADEEVVEEKVEDAIEDKAEDDITVDDLFEDDIEVEITDDDIAKEDEEKEEDE